MKIKLKRIARKERYTIGRLFIDGVYFCDTLEDKDRGLKQSMQTCDLQHIKIKNKTAIPTGVYSVMLGFSPKFQRVLPRLLSVPAFSGVLIHRGNHQDHTSGCILVGENKAVGKVLNSTHYEQKLLQLLKNEKKITLEIV